MSIRRLGGTAAVMALIAGALTALTPGISAMAATLVAAQRTVDTAGPDVLVLSAAGLLAWAVWAWGALGLTLTAASVLPGLLGGAARIALHVVLPAGARRSAALALGLGLGVAGPLLGSVALMTPTPAAATDAWTAPSTAGVPDWPAATDAGATPDRSASTTPQDPAPQGPAPDWPTAAPVAGTHVVVRGDCLWHIASDRLLAEHGRTPTDGEVAAATRAWWQANAEVIGPDPDLLLPGQVLSPPDPA
jgi:nucleoid-associated protein YgaU